MEKDDQPNYKTIKLPRAMLEKLDQYVKDHPELGYSSSSDLIRQCIRQQYLNLLTMSEKK